VERRLTQRRGDAEGEIGRLGTGNAVFRPKTAKIFSRSDAGKPDCGVLRLVFVAGKRDCGMLQLVLGSDQGDCGALPLVSASWKAFCGVLRRVIVRRKRDCGVLRRVPVSELENSFVQKRVTGTEEGFRRPFWRREGGELFYRSPRLRRGVEE
jgi:hypothetical protein